MPGAQVRMFVHTALDPAVVICTPKTHAALKY